MPAQQAVARGTSTAHECSFACSSEFTMLVYEAVVACLSAESQQTAEAAAAAAAASIDLGVQAGLADGDLD